MSSFTRDQLVRQVWRLRDEGKGDHEIANETGLAVVDIRRILAAPRPRA